MGVCTDHIIEWLKDPETLAHIKAAGEQFSRSDIEKIVNDIKNHAKNLYRSQNIPIAEAIELAQKMKLEGLEEKSNIERVNARLSAIRKAQRSANAKANNWNAAKVESAWFSGNLHRGVGVRGGLNAISNVQYLLITKAKGGVLEQLEKINGVPVLRDPIQAAKVVDQVLKQDFSDDLVGKVARVIDNHNDLSLKLQRQAGIPIRKLAGRVTKQFHDPIRLLNPKGFNKRLAQELGVARLSGGLAVKKIAGIGSEEFERLKVNLAFEMWKDYIKPKLDWNLSFMEVDHQDADAIDKTLRATFDSIIHQVSPKKESGNLDVGELVSQEERYRGKKSLASRLASPSRTFFFKDGTSWVNYARDYGAGGLLESIDRDARTTARSIGLVKMFGPNAEDVYEKLRSKLIEKNRGLPSTDRIVKKMDRQMDLVTGKLSGGTASKIAVYAQNIEAFNVLTKLGYVVLHSLSDLSNQWGSMSYAGMTFPEKIQGQIETVRRMFIKGSEEDQDFLDCLGVGTKHIIGSVNRFGVDPNSAAGLMSKAQGVMFKLNGLQWWDHGLKQGTMAVYSRYLARNAGKSFDQLNPKLQRILGLYNWKPEEWDVWRKNGIKLVDKKSYLTPDGFMNANDSDLKGLELSREDLYTKAFMFLEDQYKYVVPGSTLIDQANRALRMQTPLGAVINLLMQFKTYGINFVRNILIRNIFGSDNRFEVAAALVQTVVGTAALGYAGQVAEGIVKNKQPPPLSGPGSEYTWSKAMLPSLGIFGDMVSAGTDSKTDIFSEISPFSSNISDALTYFKTMGKRAVGDSQTRDRKSSALLSFEFAKRNLPFMNTIPATVIFNWAIGKEIMDTIQPGSYQEMQQRSQNYTGQAPIIP